MKLGTYIIIYIHASFQQDPFKLVFASHLQFNFKKKCKVKS